MSERLYSLKRNVTKNIWVNYVSFLLSYLSIIELKECYRIKEHLQLNEGVIFI